jgi:hypothetical protein
VLELEGRWKEERRERALHPESCSCTFTLALACLCSVDPDRAWSQDIAIVDLHTRPYNGLL